MHSCENPQVVAVHTTINIPANGVREVLDRVISVYEEIDGRFAAAGGLSRLLSLYEQLQRELERVSYEEIDRMTGDIKGVIETLLTMDYELRRVNNLKPSTPSSRVPAAQGESRELRELQTRPIDGARMRCACLQG